MKSLVENIENFDHGTWNCVEFVEFWVLDAENLESLILEVKRRLMKMDFGVWDAENEIWKSFSILGD